MTASRSIVDRSLTPDQRFDSFVTPEPNSGCFLWIGGATPQGYGTFWDGKRLVRAPRYAWEREHGPIPPGKWALHKCDNPPCVNPLHLFLGDNTLNVLDCVAKKRFRNQRVTHCPAGHEYSNANTYRDKADKRYCRTCRAASETHRDRTNRYKSLRRKGAEKGENRESER